MNALASRQHLFGTLGRFQQRHIAVTPFTTRLNTYTQKQANRQRTQSQDMPYARPRTPVIAICAALSITLPSYGATLEAERDLIKARSGHLPHGDTYRFWKLSGNSKATVPYFLEQQHYNQTLTDQGLPYPATYAARYIFTDPVHCHALSSREFYVAQDWISTKNRYTILFIKNVDDGPIKRSIVYSNTTKQQKPELTLLDRFKRSTYRYYKLFLTQ